MLPFMLAFLLVLELSVHIPGGITLANLDENTLFPRPGSELSTRMNVSGVNISKEDR